MRNHVGYFKRTFFGASGKFCRSGEENIAGTVERRFAGVLQNANDEAYTYNLHGDIITDTERSTGNRNEQQRTAGNTGSVGKST